MAIPSKKLIRSIRKTAKNLRNNPEYQWGHMGLCNCGFLVQELTQLSQDEIHQYAMQGSGDWSEQVEAYCPTSSMPMDLLISELIAHGLRLEDLIHLERLNDHLVLSLIPAAQNKPLRHNDSADVALYLEYWAVALEQQLGQQTNSPVMFI